jgi:hypothetical protein
MNTAIIILLILGMVPWTLTLRWSNGRKKVRYLNWIINGIALVLFIIKIKGV